MKKILLIGALLFASIIYAQITPVLVNQNLSNSEFYPQTIGFYDGDIYFPDLQKGKIIKTSTLTTNAPVEDVLTNLGFPFSLKIIGDELYFLQAVTTPNLTNNSGKLSKIDLTQANPTVVDVISGLNVPTILDGNANELYFTELIGNFTPDGDLDIQSTSISKVNLNGTVSKTVILQNRNFIADLKLNGNDLYWNEEFDDFSDKLHKYNIDMNNPSVEDVFTFTDDYPLNFYINNNIYYYSGFEFINGSEVEVIKTLDLTENPLSPTQISNSFSFGSTDVETSAMYVDNDDLFVAALGYNFNNGQEDGLLFQLDLSTLSISDFEPQTEINFYPNPAEDHITFDKNIVELSIFDRQAKLVKKFETQSNVFDVSYLNTGFYFMKIKRADNSFITKKLIVK